MKRLILCSLAAVALSACGSSNSNTSTSTGSSTGTGAATTATSTSSGTGGSSGAGGGKLGMPLTAPSEQWTWVDFPDAFCANGVTTGIGVNLSTKSPRVLIYLEGGGACWSDITCYTLKTASFFVSGYTKSDFMTESTDAQYLAQPGGLFDRASATNPFKDYSYIYVPYCTGDVHAGDNVFKYPSGPANGTMHVGYKNMDAYLKRIVPTFTTADRAYIAGSSAGGFGAALNWWHAQEYFGSVRVDLIDDSGTPMPLSIEQMGMGETIIRMQWNLAATFPPACTQCKTSVDGILAYYAQTFSTHRATLLSYVQDTTLPNYYQISTQQFETGLNDELTTYFKAGSTFQYFTNPGAGHVLYFSPTLMSTAGVSVEQFLTKMVTDDPTWASTM